MVVTGDSKQQLYYFESPCFNEPLTGVVFMIFHGPGGTVFLEFPVMMSAGEDHHGHNPPDRILSLEHFNGDIIEPPRSSSVRIPTRNETGQEKAYYDSESFYSYGGKHEHLLKSGPLGRCNDPYCTTCPTDFDYHGPSAQSLHSVREAFWGGAKNVQSKIRGWSRIWFPSVLNPHTKFVQRWNQFFVISCLVAIFIDPLFFLLFSVNQKYYCITFNQTFAMIITVLRSVTDFIYFLHMVLQFRLAYLVPSSRTVGAGELVDDPKKIAHNYLGGWFVLDLFAVLPLPQIMIWIVVSNFQGREANANFAKNILRVTVLLQYVPRCVRFLPLVAGHSQSGFIFETAWVNFVINLFMYLLAGHVVGACWYLFGLQRVNLCLHNTCVQQNNTCHSSFLDCGNGKDIIQLINQSITRQTWVNTSTASDDCLVGPNITFPYGIYTFSVPVTMEPNVIVKYIYSLFWGFLQISTLAGNLVPSLFVWEVLFTMGVIGLGLLLFALLIGNMQNFLQSLGRRQMDMQLRRYDMDSWMRRRNLPLDVRRRVIQAERLKWAATRGVDEDELLEGLPEDLHKEIRRILAWDYIKKVRLFQVMEDIVLDAICERLHQKFYIENSLILRAKYPVDRMLFILRGKLLSVGDDGSKVTLSAGDFCGEELLIWCLGHNTLQQNSRGNKRPSQRALSSRTVKCVSNVEAFSLEATDLEFVTNHFSRYMRNPRVQGAIRYESPYWRTWAAGCIQAAWRYRRRKLGKSQSMQHHINGRTGNGDKPSNIR